MAGWLAGWLMTDWWLVVDRFIAVDGLIIDWLAPPQVWSMERGCMPGRELAADWLTHDGLADD